MFDRSAYAPWLERVRVHALSVTLQAIERELCRRDPAHFISSWCMTFDPRIDGLKTIPFNLYEYQVTLVRELNELRKDNWHMDKSRDMGITWTVLAYFVWRFCFEPGYSALLMSKKADDVDNSTLSSLMPKCEFILKRLPPWLRPKYTRSYMRIINEDHDGTFIHGTATTEDAGRSGRYTDCLLDEFASVDRSHAIYTAVTGSLASRVLFLSTPQGRNNKFAELKFDANISMVKRSFHWSIHPNKGQDWYEREKKRIGDPVSIAQELDISYTASVRGRIFPMFARETHVKSWSTQEVTRKGTGWDYGKVDDPTVCLWYEVFEAFGNRCIYVYQELEDQEHKELPSWWALQWLELSGRDVVSAYGDPAGDQRERDMVSYVQDLYAETTRLIDEVPAFKGRQPLIIDKKHVEVGYALLAMRKGFIGERIFVSENCPHTIEALANYRAKTAREGHEQAKRASGVENIVPVHDRCSHFADALRYIVINELPDLLQAKPKEIRTAEADDYSTRRRRTTAANLSLADTEHVI